MFKKKGGTIRKTILLTRRPRPLRFTGSDFSCNFELSEMVYSLGNSCIYDSSNKRKAWARQWSDAWSFEKWFGLSHLCRLGHRQPKVVAWHRWRNTCANDCSTQVTSFIADNTRFFLCTWAACVTTSHSYLHVKEIFFSKIEVFLAANMHDLNNYQKDLKRISKHLF